MFLSKDYKKDILGFPKERIELTQFYFFNQRGGNRLIQSVTASQSVEEAGVKREQNTGFFEIEVQKEGEGEGNKADGNPATCV